jgi:hypothetical protein
LQENRADIWDNANALAVVVGGTSDDLRYLKSISLHLWLFGYELPGKLQLSVPCMLPIGNDLLSALLCNWLCTWGRQVCSNVVYVLTLLLLPVLQTPSWCSQTRHCTSSPAAKKVRSMQQCDVKQQRQAAAGKASQLQGTCLAPAELQLGQQLCSMRDRCPLVHWGCQKLQ